MTEFFDFAQKLSGAPFAVLMFAILYGGYKRIWVWGYQLEKSEATTEFYKDMALRAAGLAETSVNIAKITRS